MLRARIAGIGKYLPEQIVRNQDLLRYMDTSDEWIQERTGIQERRYAHRTQETTTTMGVAAAQIAMDRAGVTAADIDFIIFATLLPVVLFAKLHNIYIVLLIVTTLWMGTIGFIDDYIKIFKKDKQGLKGIFKVIGQVGLGLIVGSVLYFSPAVTVRENVGDSPVIKQTTENVIAQAPIEVKSTATTIPFFKVIFILAFKYVQSSKLTWLSKYFTRSSGCPIVCKRKASSRVLFLI